MSADLYYFVSYEGELDDADRTALTRPEWKLYENGVGHTGAFRGEDMPPIKWRQVIRIQAPNGEHALQQIVDALGREPSRLRVVQGQHGPSESRTWWLSIRGPMTSEFSAAIDRAAGISFTGTRHSLGYQESHSVWVQAATPEDAVERVREAVDGLPLFVDESTIRDPSEDM